MLVRVSTHFGDSTRVAGSRHEALYMKSGSTRQQLHTGVAGCCVLLWSLAALAGDPEAMTVYRSVGPHAWSRSATRRTRRPFRSKWFHRPAARSRGGTGERLYDASSRCSKFSRPRTKRVWKRRRNSTTGPRLRSHRSRARARPRAAGAVRGRSLLPDLFAVVWVSVAAQLSSPAADGPSGPASTTATAARRVSARSLTVFR